MNTMTLRPGRPRIAIEMPARAEAAPRAPRVLRVIHIGTESTWRGGENQLLTLALGLRARGHENLIVAQPGSQLAARARNEGIAVRELRMRGEWDLWAGWRLRRLAREWLPDIVHAHTAHAHSMGLAVAGRLAARRPLLVVSRRVDFTIGRGASSRRKYLSPRCHYIAISHGVRDALTQGGVDPGRVRVVFSGVDPARFNYRQTGAAARAEWGCGPGHFLIGNVGALTDHKAQDVLIRAAARVLGQAPEARFVIAGEGELRGALTRQIEATGLAGRFHLLGYRDDIENCLMAFDLFVLSSRLEGLCTSIIDAMLLGTPVVATRTGGVPDLVRDGITGLMAPPEDDAALAAAILRLMREDELGLRLASRAREQALSEFTNERMIDGTQEVYFDLLAETGRVA